MDRRAAGDDGEPRRLQARGGERGVDLLRPRGGADPALTRPRRLAALAALAGAALLGAALLPRADGTIPLAALLPAAWRIDPWREETCRRVVEALEPDAAPEVVTVRPRGDGLALAYAVPDRPGRVEAVCTFAPGPDGDALVAVTGPRGPLGEAELFVLRRFHLDAADRPAPPSPFARARLPEWSPVLARIAQAILAAVPLVAVGALLSGALALGLGLVRRFDLAFGALAAAGGYGAAGAVAAAGVGAPGLALGGALVGGCLAAAVAGAVTAHPFARLAREGQGFTIAGVGLALALTEGLRLAEVPGARWARPLFGGPLPVARAGEFVVTLTPAGALVTFAAGLAAAALALGMRRTAFGRAWRAAADDPLAARLNGVDPDRVLRASLVLGAALAGFGGALLALLWGGVGHASAPWLALHALVGAVLGGGASVARACLGGAALTVAEGLWSHLVSVETRDLAVYAALALALALRGGGPEAPRAGPGR